MLPLHTYLTVVHRRDVYKDKKKTVSDLAGCPVGELAVVVVSRPVSVAGLRSCIGRGMSAATKADYD